MEGGTEGAMNELDEHVVELEVMVEVRDEAGGIVLDMLKLILL